MASSAMASSVWVYLAALLAACGPGATPPLDMASTIDIASLSDLTAAPPDLATSDLAPLEAGLPPCGDGVRDGNETDIDCGGLQCAPCGDFQRCVADADCKNKRCVAGFCGAAAFSSPTDMPVMLLLYVIQIADVDGDGKQDIVGVGDVGAVVIFNSGGQKFSAPVYPGLPGPSASVVIGDYNGDGWKDVATCPGDVCIALNQGNRTFKAPLCIPLPMGSPWGMVSADFDGDGKMDLATGVQSDNFLYLLHNKGNAMFTTSAVNVDAKYDVTTGDLDLDGRPDIVSTGPFEAVSLTFNNAGSLRPLGSLIPPTALDVLSPIIADLDGDGLPEVAVFLYPYDDQKDTQIAIWKNLGKRMFDPKPKVIDAGPCGTSLVVADFNGDSRNDIFVSYCGDKTSRFLFNRGGGQFTAPMAPLPNRGVGAAGDLNGDGKADLVIGEITSDNPPMSTIHVFFNTTP